MPAKVLGVGPLREEGLVEEHEALLPYHAVSKLIEKLIVSRPDDRLVKMSVVDEEVNIVGVENLDLLAEHAPHADDGEGDVEEVENHLSLHTPTTHCFTHSLSRLLMNIQKLVWKLCCTLYDI